jgi:radical SAM superfamily enzyme YgiQ (UPF0313 family)
MKVSFVIPPFDYTGALGSKKKMTRGFLPSLGIGYLASSIEARGHEASLVDAQVLALDIDETVEAILANDPEVVAISAMSVYAEAGYRIAEKLRGLHPKLFIVMGGPHTTSFYKVITEECPHVDVVIPGEAEITLADLVDRLARKESWHDLPGLVYRNGGGEQIVTGRAPVVQDMDSLPHPTRHIFDQYDYRPLPNQVRREPATTMITSRGCSWAKCTFCYQGGAFSPAYRRRSPENVVEEIGFLVRERGIREIIFWDDTFAVNAKWIERFCDLLDREDFNILWSCYGHMRAVRPDMLKRMSKSGCYNLYYGFESGVQEILDLVKKGTTRQQIRDAVRWAKDAGIQIRGSFILGFPTETPEQTQATIDFACELNADWMMFFPFRLSPGTDIEELAHQDARLIDTQDAVHFPSYVSSGYQDQEELSAMVKKAYTSYYLRPSYFSLVAATLVKHPSMLTKYYEAFQFWLDLTREKKVWA